ncbi:hypothetical protein FRC07_008357 [Ceratobasidium sp. 392]|nr:hypothetical protein FRC07_008357 [Ceratobasidium sp. 392]
MFFTRLAIVALSFGSAVTVFAAPLGSLPSVGIVVAVELTGQARGVPAFSTAVADATIAAKGLKSEIVALADNPVRTVTPKLVATMGQLDAAIAPVADMLATAGISKDALLVDADGVTIAPDTLIQSVSSLVAIFDPALAPLNGLESLELITDSLTRIKEHLTTYQNVLDTMFPGATEYLDRRIEIAFVAIDIVVVA